MSYARRMQPALEASLSLWRPLHETDGATVFHVDLTPDAPRETEALGWLDAAERSRRDRFLYPRPRREFTLCRAALRSLLCRELGCCNAELSFETAKFGKPFALVGGVPVPAAFNVSHSGPHGLIALAPRGRIGVDVEERSTKRSLDDYIRLLFAPEERAELEKSRGRGRVELFYRLWTLKEAAIKAVGAGLSIDPATFEIPPGLVRGERTGVFSFPDTPEVRWRLENIGNARFAAAIAREAVESADRPVRRKT
ncbi:MAG: 4'-phosphopantetheinyl transferase superfamily protein [Rhodospirillaceae bacterium]|nr:4'-phosphopantetheinyl transferase superfamily protein [Rhodospirillaceae bacterium]